MVMSHWWEQEFLGKDLDMLREMDGRWARTTAISSASSSRMISVLILVIGIPVIQAKLYGILRIGDCRAGAHRHIICRVSLSLTKVLVYQKIISKYRFQYIFQMLMIQIDMYMFGISVLSTFTKDIIFDVREKQIAKQSPFVKTDQLRRILAYLMLIHRFLSKLN